MRWRVAILVAFVAGTASWCATTTSSLRHGPGGACVSDRECLYGLVCREAGDGGARTCRYENWGACDEDGDCLDGPTCREGTCTVQCVADEHCDGGVCEVGECRAPPDRECVLSTDCGLGRDCVAGRCVERAQLRCFSDLDCRPGERCFGGWCR